MKKIAPIFLGFLILLPAYAAAAGVVPCDGVTVPCNFNSLIGLVNNIINWFLGVTIGIAAITASWAGIQIFLNPTNPAAREKGIGMAWKTLVGVLIVLCAWVIVRVVITLFVKTPGALQFLGN